MTTYRVKFVVFKGEVIACFPDCPASRDGRDIMTYAHIGQHGGASKSLLRYKRATPEQYAPLLRELKGLYAPDNLGVL